MKYWNSTQLIQFTSGISIERDYTEMLIPPFSAEFSGSGSDTYKVLILSSGHFVEQYGETGLTWVYILPNTVFGLKKP